MDVSESEINKLLSVSASRLAKQTRDPVPVPDHLVGEFIATKQQQQHTLSDAVAHSFLSQARERGAADHSEYDIASLLKELALAECESQVPELASWKERIQAGLVASEECQDVLGQTRKSVTEMLTVTKSVQDQSDRLSQDASVLMVRKVKLERVQAQLQSTIHHFTHVEDLVREAQDPMLSVNSARFSGLFQELETEMEFLSRNSQFKSAKTYATNLALAQDQMTGKLKAALEDSFREAKKTIMRSEDHIRATHLPTYSAACELTVAAVAGVPTAGPVAASPSNSMPSCGDATSERWAGLHVDLNDMGGSLASFLKAINSLFMDGLRDHASLRRMVELRKSFSSTGAESFGENMFRDSSSRRSDGVGIPLSAAAAAAQGGLNDFVEQDKQLQDILTAYFELRKDIMTPLIGHWVERWSYYVRDEMREQRKRFFERTSNGISKDDNKDSNDVNVLSDSATAAAATAATVGSITSLTASVAPGKSSSSEVYAAYFARIEGNFLPEFVNLAAPLLEVFFRAEREVLEEVWLREDFVALLFPRIISEFGEVVCSLYRNRLFDEKEVKELTDILTNVRVLQQRMHSSKGIFPGKDGEVFNGSCKYVLTKLWTCMRDDAQERIMFRTGVYIKEKIAGARVPPELIQQYLHLSANVGSSSATGTPTAPPPVSPVSPTMPLLPAVRDTVVLLKMLYPAIEFTVFSVYTEEAINISLRHARNAEKMIESYQGSVPTATLRAHACRAAHILYLQDELSRIDGNILVVEKSLDLYNLIQRRITISQSSREAKKDVEYELAKCAESLVVSLMECVAGSVKESENKSYEELEQSIAKMEKAYASNEAILAQFVGDARIRASLLGVVREQLESQKDKLEKLQAQQRASQITPASSSP